MSRVKDRLNEIRQFVEESPNGDAYVDIQETDDVVPSSQKKKDKKTTIKRENKDLKKTFDKATQIRELIVDIEANVQKADELEHQAQKEIFRAPVIIKEINAKFGENTNIARKAASKLKELHSEIKKIEDETSAESRIKIIQFESLKQQLKEALNRNSVSLEKFRTLQINNLKAEIRIANVNYDEEDLERLLEDNKNPFHVFTDNILADTQEAKRQLEEIEERHKQLLVIEEHLKEVHELFQRIAVLVEIQQESVNRVEYHATAATEYIEAVDLSKVRRKRTKYLKRKCCIILTLSVLFIIIIVAIVY